jgi:hypothetical protein
MSDQRNIEEGGGRKKFKYELMWETHEEFYSTMKQTWQSDGCACTVQELQQKMTTVAGHPSAGEGAHLVTSLLNYKN